LRKYSRTLTWEMVLSSTSLLLLGLRQTINVSKMNFAIISAYRHCSCFSITCLVRVSVCSTPIHCTLACLHKAQQWCCYSFLVVCLLARSLVVFLNRLASLGLQMLLLLLTFFWKPISSFRYIWLNC
jgi:hypothetical protein